ncbi:hypothetical protein PAHAL_2G176000 [Panicum hallii]|uniref:Uncharacterized protein n=1 Tax=Panicum hallii TaxID=206008 RepID=A0A2T8KPH5_9POAL|nr:hypothetical protein PAHAL_2G176000 [Panicum hallii]
MPEEADGEDDVDSLVMGVEDMNVARTQDELTVWTRSDIEANDADVDLLADGEHDTDNTYIDDGHVAPVNSIAQGDEDDIFV